MSIFFIKMGKSKEWLNADENNSQIRCDESAISSSIGSFTYGNIHESIPCTQHQKNQQGRSEIILAGKWNEK